MTRAMILAAGRGRRMRPMTDVCPKPLVKVAGKPIIMNIILQLKQAGIHDVVINLSHLGYKIKDFLKENNNFGINITFSEESPAPLEVGGGIFRALPMLGKEPFIVVNGDVWSDFDFSKLPKQIDGLGHLVLVENPAHNPQGDFAIDGTGLLVKKKSTMPYTYAGIGVLSPSMFEHCQAGSFPLTPLLESSTTNKQLTGEVYNGLWKDVGTLSRLQELEQILLARQHNRKTG